MCSFSTRIVLAGLLFIFMLYSNQGRLQSNLALITITKIILPSKSDQMARLYSPVYKITEYNASVDRDLAMNTAGLVSVEYPTSGLITAKVLLYSLTGQIQSVLRLNEEFASLCRDRPLCQFLVGEAYYLRKMDTAVPEYWRNTNLWYSLARSRPPAIKSQDDFANWQRFYNLLLKIRPDAPDAYFSLGDLYSAEGRWSDALPYLEKAVALDSSNGPYLCTLGIAEVNLHQDVDQGLALCARALVVDPNTLWLYGSVAEAYAQASRCIEAKRVLENARSHFPGSPDPGLWLNAFNFGKMGHCSGRDM